ncbi:hypothetical protein [Natrononativus amylolyticus]|uniref:hypothetical protein n=1 Tax=Natrononativus amylolyticus TaxID=2963434 RepID=UPI0020CC479F|nr:hypothetical protein [Natrononativus amylolyticus]
MSTSTPSQTPTVPELPSLEPGITLLETGDNPRGPLHTLVVDHVLTTRGRAVWVDTHGHATTQPLARLAPTPRVLDRIHVARGFTQYQHVAIVDALATHLDDDTEVIVVPAVDALYRADECYRGEGTELLLQTLATLARYSREHDVPVLVTRTRADAFSEPVAAAAGETIHCEHTREGPRFVADGFETLVYPTSHGHVQTTLAFWQRILEARRPLYDHTPAHQTRPQEVFASGSH